MSAWGEFAFILATTSKAEGILDEKQFSTITMAVLLSVIVGPICLSYSISLSKKRAAHMQLTEPMLHDASNSEIAGDPMQSLSMMSMPGATTLPSTFDYERRHSWWRKESDEEELSGEKKLEHTTLLLPIRQKCIICGRSTSYACFACCAEKEGMTNLCHPAKRGRVCWKIWHDQLKGKIGFAGRGNMQVMRSGPQPISLSGATSLSVNQIPQIRNQNLNRTNSGKPQLPAFLGIDANQTM